MSILVLGDVMLDKYWFSQANELASEAPVLNINIDAEQYRAGGAANVALNITQLAKPGTNIAILAPLGLDKDGDILSGILEGAGINCYWQHNGSQTITKHRIISQKKQLVRVDFEDQNSPIELTPEVKNLIDSYKVIVISDYNKGALSSVQQIIAYAKAKDKYILVDPKGSDFTKYSSATLLTPNLSEFTSIVGEINSEKDLDQKANKLIDMLELESILVTRSADGMTFYSKDGDKYHACSYAEDVYDVTGAGDTVIASLAVSFSDNNNINTAIEYASHAAALVVSQVGTASVSRDDVAANMLLNKSLIDNININDKLINFISEEDFIEYLVCNISDNSKVKNILIWDGSKNNILTAKNTSQLISLHNQSISIILVCTDTDASRSAHSLSELATMLASLKSVARVLYSNNLDLKEILAKIEHGVTQISLPNEIVLS